jgi:hypothetical protein
MKLLPLTLAFLLGKSMREQNSDSDRSEPSFYSGPRSPYGIAADWAINYAAIVGMLVVVSMYFLNSVLDLSLHRTAPLYAGILTITSAYIVFWSLLLLDQKWEYKISGTVTKSMRFEWASAIIALAIYGYLSYTGVIASLQWYTQMAVGLIPAALFGLSSRVAEFFGRPAVRAELKQYGPILSMVLILLLLDWVGRFMFGRSFIAESTLFS